MNDAIRAIIVSGALLFSSSLLGAAQGYDNRPLEDVPSSVVGGKFDVVVDDHGDQQKATLLFKTKELFCGYFSRWNLTSIPFTEVKGKKEADPVTFSATFADAAGSTIACTGTATGDEIVGELVVKPIGGSEDRRSFSGGKTGSPAAKKALEKLKP